VIEAQQNRLNLW